MKRSALVALLAALALPLFAAPKERYLVMTRVALRESRGVLRDTLDSTDRAVRPFRNIEAFAVDLTAEEAKAMRAAGDVRVVERVVPRFISDRGTTSSDRGTTLSDRGTTFSSSPRTDGAMKPAAPFSFTDHQTIPWGLDAIHARDVWPVTRGAGVNVAVIDTGMDLTHPDLQVAYAGGYNTLNPAATPRDDNHHGTHVAGTIAATDNGFGVVGVAPDVHLWVVKVLDQSGTGDSEHVAAGVDWVLSKKKAIGGNWVINLSLGSVDKSDVEEAMFARAIAEGVIVVAAAGNSAWDFIDYPAGYPGVMAIGAMDEASIAAVWENRGALSVIAPGIDVLSTIPVGLVRVSDITLSDGNLIAASPLTGSPMGDVHASYVLCGVGHPADFPPAVQGNIAVVNRGEITFNEKTRNAKAAGAKAVVIVSRQDDGDDVARWTLIGNVCDDSGNNCVPDPAAQAFDWPVTLGVSWAQGQQIVGGAGTLSMLASSRSDDYVYFNGTSMATPHVVATAALAWSLAPQLSSAEIRHAIEASAHDLGDPGFDTRYGNGSLDALATAKLVAPGKFGIAPPRRRGVQH
jgi:subtilisin family serine protease